MRRGYWVILVAFSMLWSMSSAQAESLLTDTSAWISTQYPKASLRQPLQVVKSIQAHTTLNNVPFELMVAVIAVESGFRPTANSPTGAKGLTQVVPYWHRDKIRKRNLHNPDVAIEVGTEILRDCYIRFKRQDRALRCYSGYSGKRATGYINRVSRELRKFTAFREAQQESRVQLAGNQLRLAYVLSSLD